MHPEASHCTPRLTLYLYCVGNPSFIDDAGALFLDAGGAKVQGSDSTSGVAADTELYTCMHMCGFTGSYSTVEAHEVSCPMRPDRD
jgi:hypothetical protein